MEFFGGLALVLGAATRTATLLIIVFTIVATLISHRYWELTDAAARRMQYSHFAKNLTIVGGSSCCSSPQAGGFRWTGGGGSENALRFLLPLRKDEAAADGPPAKVGASIAGACFLYLSGKIQDARPRSAPLW